MKNFVQKDGAILRQKEKKFYIIVGILVFTLVAIGVTYAYWMIPKTQEGTNIVNSRCFELTVDEGDAINMENAFPLLDMEGQATTPYHFTITNTCSSTFDYQINLESLVNTTLLPAYIKASINNETPFLLSSKESVSTTMTGSTDSRKLLVGSLSSGVSISYDLRLWIDYNSTIEQSANKDFFSKIVVINAMGTKNARYNDGVIASSPEVYHGLVPVRYDENNNLVTVDLESDIGWYNYANHEWANAVLVKYSDNTIKNKYFNADFSTKAGVQVDIENDVLQMYVWIPRYKYKLWNAENGTSNPQAIDITFVGTDTKNPAGKLESEYRNNEWYVHPAFTFGETELSGIWVGKFEMTGTVTAPTILPNQKSMTNTTAGTTLNVSTMFNTSQNIAKTNSSRYGVASEEIDTHMMKNSEWGAVAYLTNSIYGRYNADKTCISSGCEVWINNVNTGYGNLEGAQYTGQLQYGPSITGCAGTGVSVTWNNNKTACDEGYDWLQLGVKASTTGNVTGIYDMSGGAWEYVMGNMYDSDGTTPRYQSSGFNASTMPDSKYYDTYAYQASDGTTGTTAADSLARYHLGEGTRETLRTIAVNTSAGWYNDYNYVIFSSYPWVIRGGTYSAGSSAGLFSFSRDHGGASSSYSFRSVLSGK